MNKHKGLMHFQEKETKIIGWINFTMKHYINLKPQSMI